MLADDLGNWYGRGLGLSYQYIDTVIRSISLTAPAELSLRHIMRNDKLTDIEQIGIIFTSTYCRIWDKSLAQCGYSHPPVTREMLIKLMGKTLDKIIQVIVPAAADDVNFFQTLDRNEREMMPELGGRLYPGVSETIHELSDHYRLFMISNCSSHGLPNFLRYTGLETYITLSNGDTNLDKAGNIEMMVKRHGLKRPIYVGDTQGDFDACEKACIDFAFASYGFGTVSNPPHTLTKFSDLPDILRS